MIVGGRIYYYVDTKRIYVATKYYSVSKAMLHEAMIAFPSGTFVVLCVCDGTVQSIQNDIDIDDAVCHCISEGADDGSVHR